ncbi:hypothetical protein, partial [Brucella intermedia]|uniref:hypothetical protein n=1 Tax=Brucella intermedia TaxID=94625 RepID=UPI001AECAC59
WYTASKRNRGREIRPALMAGAGCTYPALYILMVLNNAFASVGRAVALSAAGHLADSDWQ